MREKLEFHLRKDWSKRRWAFLQRWAGRRAGKVLGRPVSYGAGLLTVRREERGWRRWKTETKKVTDVSLCQAQGMAGLQRSKMTLWAALQQNPAKPSGGCAQVVGAVGTARTCFPLAAFPPSRRRLIMSLGRFYSSGFEPKSCMWFSNSHFITPRDYFHYVWLTLSLFRFSRDIKGLNQSNIRCVWDSVSCMHSVNKHWWKNILAPNSATPNPTNMHIKAP